VLIRDCSCCGCEPRRCCHGPLTLAGGVFVETSPLLRTAVGCWRCCSEVGEVLKSSGAGSSSTVVGAEPCAAGALEDGEEA